MTENHKRALLVTGASGHLGRRVVELLLETQAGRVVATTRNPERTRTWPRAASPSVRLISTILARSSRSSRAAIDCC